MPHTGNSSIGCNSHPRPPLGCDGPLWPRYIVCMFLRGVRIIVVRCIIPAIDEACFVRTDYKINIHPCNAGSMHVLLLCIRNTCTQCGQGACSVAVHTQHMHAMRGGSTFHYSRGVHAQRLSTCAVHPYHKIKVNFEIKIVEINESTLLSIICLRK